MSHLKTEIIYYCGTADFEFEFNLNATSPMRLFTENPTDEKSLISSLSLAVSRSRITFITADFDDKFVETIANTIGFKTETIVPEEYGITKKMANKFITNGVPLVTSNGVYGGIILESGPQSLILITNDRPIRKQLMSELVKGYIIDLSETPNESLHTAAVEEKADIDTMPEEIETEEAPSTDIFSGSLEPTETQDESEAIPDIVSVPQADEDIFDDIPKQKQTKKKNVFAAILAIILFLLIAFIVYSLVIEPFLNNISIAENFKQIFGFLYE